MLDHETLIDLQRAAVWLHERTGRRPHVATLHRWATRGVRGVKLETVTAGHLRLTSIEAIGRFMTSAPQEPAVAVVPIVPPRRTVKPTRKESPAVAEFACRVFPKSRRTVRAGV